MIQIVLFLNLNKRKKSPGRRTPPGRTVLVYILLKSFTLVWRDISSNNRQIYLTQIV